MYCSASHAKVNLFLNIVGREKNSYHSLQSFFCLLNLTDHITIKPSTNTNCIIDRDEIVDNVVYKAVNYFNKLNNVNKIVNIKIKKNIPISSGLGGGSSNAATVLKLLEKLYNFPKLDAEKLKEIANNIGADVPFFYINKNAFVEGIGEKIMPIKLNMKIFILLINPGIKVITKDIFSSVSYNFSSRIRCNKKSIINEIVNGKNDLEKYVRQKYTIVNDLLNFIQMQQNCLISRMSGSGSTCFGIFEKKEDVLNAKKEAEKIYGNQLIHCEKLEI
jgi:4-diphosphocytidyl-2-C-methyl-D-erythritol kinase